MGLQETVHKARETWSAKHGRCSMCAIGEQPSNGLHHSKHVCGNANGCMICRHAGMEVGNQCAACNRILMEDE